MIHSFGSSRIRTLKTLVWRWPFLAFTLFGGQVLAGDAADDAAPRQDGDPVAHVESVLANPPATGIVVTLVEHDSQAEHHGFQPGDILLSYNGETPSSITDLIRLVQGAREKEQVAVRLHRGGEERAVFLRPGRIGMDGISVEQGKGAASRPPASAYTPDFSLFDLAKDEWYLFLRDRKKVGYERYRLQRDGDRIKLRVETLYALEKQMLEVSFHAQFRAQAGLPLEDLSFEERSPGGRYRVELARQGEELAGKVGEKDFRARAPADTIPTYLSALLAGTMPLESGATVHLTLFGEGNLTLYRGTALACRGREEVIVGGKKMSLWRFEQSLYGKVGNVYDLDDQRRLVRARFSTGVEIRRSTEAEISRELPTRLLKSLAAGE
ncbi:MAG: PDZ domain-containing protein [Planctomycetes bacterium]|nr:PDZ domain-containing protein [Planctomycetota bacterium]